MDFSNRLGPLWSSTTEGTSPGNKVNFSSTNAPTTNLEYTWLRFAYNSMPPSGVTLPYTFDFDAAWANSNTLNGDVPSNAWRTYPGRGEASWRSSNGLTSNGAIEGWNFPANGTLKITAPAAGSYARFHSLTLAPGLKGFMDLYIDFTTAGTKLLKFDFKDSLSLDGDFDNNNDSLIVYISTDGGNNFTAKKSFNNINQWATQTVDLGNSTSNNVVIRFEAVGDNNFATANDIGIDNIDIRVDVSTPVTLTNFTAYISNKTTILNWATVNELNNKGYTIERSADRINFNELTFINSKAINGNSINKIEYSVIDKLPLNRDNYYRLKQIDKDGRFVYSNVLYVKNIISNGINFSNLYPNPATNMIKAIIESNLAGNVNFLINNAAGKTVKQITMQFNIGNNVLELNIGNLPKGTYTIKANCSNGSNTQIKQFVKN